MDFVLSPQGSLYMSIMDAAEYLRCKSGKIEEYIASGHLRLSTMDLHRRRRLVVFADVQRVRDELKGIIPSKLVEPNATLGNLPGCGACLKMCPLCKKIQSRQKAYFTTGKYSNKEHFHEWLVTKEEARDILGCTGGEIDKYVSRGKIKADFTRKYHHYFFSSIADKVQRDTLGIFDYRKERAGIVSALDQMIMLRRQEMAELDSLLIEHSVGHEEPLFRYGRAVDLTVLPGGDWYVYHLCHPNGRPFYIGKGIGDRMYHHVKEAAKGVQSYKCNLIRKLQSQGKEIRYRVVFVTPDEREAYEYEIYEIARIGMKKLTNMTPGGFHREEHDRVFGSNVPKEKLNYKLFMQRLILYPHLTEEECKRAIYIWAFDRTCELRKLLEDAVGLSHDQARYLLEKELEIVTTYTARQQSFDDLRDRRHRRFDRWVESLD